MLYSKKKKKYQIKNKMEIFNNIIMEEIRKELEIKIIEEMKNLIKNYIIKEKINYYEKELNKKILQLENDSKNKLDKYFNKIEIKNSIVIKKKIEDQIKNQIKKEYQNLKKELLEQFQLKINRQNIEENFCQKIFQIININNLKDIIMICIKEEITKIYQEKENEIYCSTLQPLA